MAGVFHKYLPIHFYEFLKIRWIEATHKDPVMYDVVSAMSHGNYFIDEIKTDDV